MNKLYFNYGVMGSGKSAKLLIHSFNETQKGHRVILCKTDANRNGYSHIGSRIGLNAEADIVFEENTDVVDTISSYDFELNEYVVVIIEESQFLTTRQVEDLYKLSRIFKMNIFCYGLLNNFKGELFEGSKRLVELSDEINEIKCSCYCGKKANTSARFRNGNLEVDGEEKQVTEDEIKYHSICYSCLNLIRQEGFTFDEYLKIFK